MTDIGSMSMVSYYNPIGIYRQQQQVTEQQQLAQHSQQQAQPVQQPAGTSSPDGPQQYWYGYPAYPHTAHHQTSGAQQYLDHPESFPNWAHHAHHHYSQLHYHQQAAVYQQQQQQPQPQASHVAAAQASHISAAQAPQISAAQTSQISASRTSQISGTRTSQISGTRASQIAAARTPQISTATTSHISAAPTSHISAAPSSHISVAPSSHISAAPTPHISAVHISAAHISAVQISAAQISAVSNEWTGENEGASTSASAVVAAVAAGEPSPPITISGSEISNPGTPTTPPSSNNNGSNNNNGVTVNNNPNANRTPNTTPIRPVQVRSPYEWMKKTSYHSQPHPACNITANCNENSGQVIHENCILDALGKTRTKDKYRVVYTDHQRLELEKEFHYNRYITMRRKAELAGNLGLSERQVKIWFQNRRAKQRKQLKKREEMDQKELKSLAEGLSSGAMAAAINLDGSSHNTMAALNLGALGAMPGMGGMHNAMMPDGSPPHVLAHQPHPLALTHSHSQHAVHSHTVHSHTVLGM